MLQSKYKFDMFDLGHDAFYEEAEARTGAQGDYTQFVDLTSFLLSPLIPQCVVDMFRQRRLSALDCAIMTVKWFAYLYFDSLYVSGFTPQGEKTTTGQQRQWRFRNALLFKDFIRTFTVSGGKLQIENSKTLRANLNRERHKFEKFWEDSPLGPDRVANLRTNEWDKIDADIYRDNLFRIVHGSGVRGKKEKELLRLVWKSIEQGYAWGYEHKVVGTFLEASAKTNLIDDELRVQLEKHLGKHLPMISQCGELRGRNIVFIYGDSYISFLGCASCEHNRKTPSLADPDTEQLCRVKGLPPLGTSLGILRRNDFAPRVRRLIFERDHEHCIAASAKMPCRGPVRLGHVVSALHTSHSLTQYDGLCLCEHHNGHMGNKNLLDVFPELKGWASDNQINSLGQNLDLVDWPPEAV